MESSSRGDQNAEVAKRALGMFESCNKRKRDEEERQRDDVENQLADGVGKILRNASSMKYTLQFKDGRMYLLPENGARAPISTFLNEDSDGCSVNLEYENDVFDLGDFFGNLRDLQNKVCFPRHT